MAVDFPGWIPATEAAEKFGITYNWLRQLVRDGLFTRGQFSTATQRPPIYLRVAELRAFKKGGIAAVAPVKAAYEAAQREELAAVTTPDVGEPIA